MDKSSKKPGFLSKIVLKLTSQIFAGHHGNKFFNHNIKRKEIQANNNYI